MKIKILFFDFDGTISDAYNLSFRSLMRILEKYDYQFENLQIRKILGRKMHEIFRFFGIPIKDIEDIKKEFFQLMVSGVRKNRIKLCVSVKPLWKLKQKYKLIVITNSEEIFIKESIKKLGLKKLFAEVYTAEKFSTKDELLKKLFKKHKIKPTQAVYIGDRFSDIEYARKAGCLAIAIHNKCSWSTKKDILEEHPDFIIKDFYELKKLLKKLDFLGKQKE